MMEAVERIADSQTGLQRTEEAIVVATGAPRVSADAGHGPCWVLAGSANEKGAPPTYISVVSL
jgi:hypothetical protein